MKFPLSTSLRRILFLAASITASWQANAQQDPQFTQYMFNTFYYNPAVAGLDGSVRLNALFRWQWIGYSPTFGDGGAPTTQMISGHHPLFKGGAGLTFVRDVLGPQTNFQAQASAAYHKQLKNVMVSVGLRAGAYAQSIDFNKFRATDPNDPLIPKVGEVTQTQPDLGVGIHLKTDKWYAGVSAFHINQPSFDMGLSQKNVLKPHFYFNGGYFYDLNFDVKLQFVTLVETDLSKTSFDVGGLVYLKDLMWGGLSFRQSEAMILMLGYSLLPDKSLKLGYSLDYIIVDQTAKQPTTHEVMLSYSLPVDLSGKKIIRTPRFRY